MADAKPRDAVTELQLIVSSMSALYANAVEGIQAEADICGPWNNTPRTVGEAAAVIDPMAETFAEQIAQAHRDFDRLASELEQAHRPEAEQLRELAQLQERHATVTEELRRETEAAEAVHARLHANLETLLDGVHEINAGHRVANL